MRNRIQRTLPSAAAIIALIALAFALAGGSDAGAKKGTKKIGLNGLKSSAQVQMVGVGPLTYASGAASVGAGSTRTVTAECRSGTTVIGGGITVSSTADEFIVDSHPARNPAGATGWAAAVLNSGGTTHSAVAFAVCASSRSVSGLTGLSLISSL